MKKLILVIAILLIFVALFRTFYSEQFTDDYYLNTPSPPVPFFGDTEEDDDILIKDYTNFLGLSTQCNTAKTIINKNNKNLRDELKIKKGNMQSSYTECKGKYKTQLERFKKFYRALNNDKEPTDRELNAATGGYTI
jgi:hypothetical protein